MWNFCLAIVPNVAFIMFFFCFSPIQCIVADFNSNSIKTQEACDFLRKFVSSHYKFESPLDVTLPVFGIGDYDMEKVVKRTDTIEPSKRKGSIVIGGTFDHVHTGHKLLFSEATLLAKKRMLIGKKGNNMYIHLTWETTWKDM